MDDIHARLKEIRNYFKLSIRDFSKEIYFTHGVYGSTEKGHREPNDRMIQLICSKFNVSKDWLLTGDGAMFDVPAVDLRLEKIIETYNTIDDTLKDALLEQSKILLKLHKAK